MAQESFLKFLQTLCADSSLMTVYNQRNLTQLIFHARNMGFNFTEREVPAVIGKLEVNVILNKDGETVDGNSRLWREMWGRCYLEYLVNHVVGRHTDEELRLLIAQHEQEDL